MLSRIAQHYKASFSHLSRETWLLSIVMLINRAGTMAVPFMSMYVTQSLHRSIGDAGLIITLFGVGAVLGAMASGYFIDRAGFRRVQILTSLMAGVLLIVFAYITHFTTLCVMTVVMSFVAEAFRPANTAAIATYSRPELLTRSYSLNRLAMNIGWALGSSVAGILAAINYHLLFWVEGLVFILVGILIYVLLPAREAPAKVPIATVKVERELSGSPWRDPFLLRFLMGVTIYTTCFILMFRLVPVYWKSELGLSESVIGLLLGLNGIIIALFEMVLVRYWEGRRPPMYYIVAGMIATGIGYAWLVAPGMAPLVMALGAVLFFTVGEMMAFPFVNTLIMENAQAHNRGKYAAAYGLTWSLAQITGPGGGALIVEAWGFTALWVTLVALCAACALYLYSIAGRRKVASVAR